MNGFLKTLVYGLAGLCLLLLAAGVTVVAALRSRGPLQPEALRDRLLSAEDRAFLAEMRRRKDEPAETAAAAAADQEQLLSDLAEAASAKRARGLVEELRRDKAALQERESWLVAREAELRAARADLQRAQRQMEGRIAELAAAERRSEDERARWAAVQAAEVERTRAFKEVERARYRDLAKLYELQKDAAWQTLRRLDATEIVRVLSEMDAKKAANLMRLAQQDQEYPAVAAAIHREMLRLNRDGDTAAQIDRLAQLYAFMKAEQVLPYLRSSAPQEVADLLRAMARAGASDKKRAELIAAIEREDAKRADEVRALLQPANAQ